MQVDEIAKQRFESFKLGLPSPTVPTAPTHRHARSHSRNLSISSTVSLPTPTCTTTHDVSPSTQSLPPPPKRNSHHRRISSVSTRRESAEMMGVSVADPVISPLEDPAEKDSIRRNALWALEGKRDGSYSKVEIPELPTPSDFPTKPSFPAGSGTYLNTAKRDSFKPSSSKDTLHTLLEEEEEEDESERSRAPPTPTTPTSQFMRSLSVRPRPPHLTLRPLSLCDNLPTTSSEKRSSLKLLALAPDVTTSNANLMNRTPAPSPTPLRPRPVLNIKLAAEPSNPVASNSPEDGARPQPTRRSSISYKTSPSIVAGLPTPETTPTCTERRFYSNNSTSSRSSMSSNGGMSASEEEFFPSQTSATRPLSASEQHFLFKSHNALLARITDLERALSFRSNANNFREGGSRPSSVASVVSVASSSSSRSDSLGGEPLDEMVRLVADLKAERDELKHDVEGWRTRVGDMEKQLGVLGNRVDLERRDAWVARSRVGLLEVERGGLEKRVGELDLENQRLLKGEAELKEQVASLLREKEEMASELREIKGKMHRDADPLSTPRAFDGPVVSVKAVPNNMKRGLGFTSVDSQSSTDVEDGESQSFGPGFKLRAVEEDEDEDDSGLAGYEDEDENDIILSPGSSFGSLDEFYPRENTIDVPTDSLATPTLRSEPTPAPAHVNRGSISKTWTFPRAQNVPVPQSAPAPTHVNRASISKTWTFPRGTPIVPVQRDVPEVDRFFRCLDDLDEPASPPSPRFDEYDEEKSKGLFAKGFSYSDEANSCFVLPANVLATAEVVGDLLDVVEEEEEEEEEEEGETEGETVVEDGEVNSGIKITFTPPAEDRDRVLRVPRKPTPTYFFEEEDEEEDEAAVPFNFGRPASTKVGTTVATSTPPSVNQSPSSIPRPRSPSSIPRPTLSKPAHFTLTSPPRSSPPTRNADAFITPPNKRGGTMPSFIPQPTSPPSRTANTATSQRSPSSFSTNASSSMPSTTFIRQPQRQPLGPVRGVAQKSPHTNAADSEPHLSLRSANISAAHQGSDMSLTRNIPPGETLKHATSCSNTASAPAPSSFSSMMSSPLAGRLSFQTLTNFIPSWGPLGTQFDASGHDSAASASQVGTPKRGYVSKQTQLERLKSRLERETLGARTAAEKKSDDAVFL